MKIRIIKRNINGYIRFIIQKKLLGLFWHDAQYMGLVEEFKTLQEAKDNICYYDGTAKSEEVVFTK